MGQKLAILGHFQGIIGATGGGRVVKNCENWGDVVYGWSLKQIHFKGGKDLNRNFNQMPFLPRTE